MDEHTSHELAYQNGYAEGHEKGYKEGFLSGFDARKQDAQKWIPVTERLPEEQDADEHDCVLVHTSNRDNLIVAREAVWKCTEFMTHWKPLHEPPKGE